MGKNTKAKNNITLFHLLVVVISIYVVFTFVKQELVISELNKKSKIAQTDIKDLKTEISDIERKIDKSDTAAYIEKIAREELDMIKPHEMIYRDKNKQ